MSSPVVALLVTLLPGTVRVAELTAAEADVAGAVAKPKTELEHRLTLRLQRLRLMVRLCLELGLEWQRLLLG